MLSAQLKGAMSRLVTSKNMMMRMSRIVRMVVWIFSFADNLFYRNEGRNASQLHRPKTLINDEVFKRFVGSVGNDLFSHNFVNGRKGV